MGDNQKLYEEICKHRFDALEKSQRLIEGNLSQMATDMGLVKNKVFNGFGDSIADMRTEVRQIRGLMWGLIATVAGAIVLAAIKMLFGG